MVGGMVGNNSCGSHSVIYGTTRDHVLEINQVGASAGYKLEKLAFLGMAAAGLSPTSLCRAQPVVRPPWQVGLKHLSSHMIFQRQASFAA